jgi:hypothetical protein
MMTCHFALPTRILKSIAGFILQVWISMVAHLNPVIVTLCLKLGSAADEGITFCLQWHISSMPTYLHEYLNSISIVMDVNYWSQCLSHSLIISYHTPFQKLLPFYHYTIPGFPIIFFSGSLSKPPLFFAH